jgi:hypothetical protein
LNILRRLIHTIPQNPSGNTAETRETAIVLYTVSLLFRLPKGQDAARPINPPLRIAAAPQATKQDTRSDYPRAV